MVADFKMPKRLRTGRQVRYDL